MFLLNVIYTKHLIEWKTDESKKKIEEKVPCKEKEQLQIAMKSLAQMCFVSIFFFGRGCYFKYQRIKKYILFQFLLSRVKSELSLVWQHLSVSWSLSWSLDCSVIKPHTKLYETQDLDGCHNPQNVMLRSLNNFSRERATPGRYYPKSENIWHKKWLQNTMKQQWPHRWSNFEFVCSSENFFHLPVYNSLVKIGLRVRCAADVCSGIACKNVYMITILIGLYELIGLERNV